MLETGAPAIRLIPAGGGASSPVVTTGLVTPTAIASDAAGNWYVADATHGTISRFGADGSVNASYITGPRYPTALYVDGFNNLYITQAGASHNVIQAYVSGARRIVAGSGSNIAADGVPAASASFVSLSAVTMDINGILYIADQGGHRVYAIDATGIIHIVAGNGTTPPQPSRANRRGPRSPRPPLSPLTPRATSTSPTRPPATSSSSTSPPPPAATTSRSSSTPALLLAPQRPAQHRARRQQRPLHLPQRDQLRPRDHLPEPDPQLRHRHGPQHLRRHGAEPHQRRHRRHQRQQPPTPPPIHTSPSTPPPPPAARLSSPATPAPLASPSHPLQAAPTTPARSSTPTHTTRRSPSPLPASANRS